MVQVDQPLTTSPVPHDRSTPIVWWLVGVAVFVLALGAVPWERWCSVGVDGFPRFCFHADLWGGSASVFGFVVLVLAAVFALFAATRGWAKSGRLPTGGMVLFAAFLAALAVKVTIVSVDAHQTASAQSLLDTRFVGLWMGLALLFVGAVCLSLALVATSSKRQAVVTIAVCIVMGGLAVPYAWSGLAWWGGPLVAPEYLGGGNGAGIHALPGVPAMLQAGLITAANWGHVSGTLDSVELVASSPPITLRGAYVITQCGDGSVTPATLGSCTDPLAGWVATPGTAFGRSYRPLLLRVQVPAPGTYRVGWFRIDYHVGPLHFEVFRTDEVTICAPAPGKHHCPGAGF